MAVIATGRAMAQDSAEARNEDRDFRRICRVGLAKLRPGVFSSRASFTHMIVSTGNIARMRIVGHKPFCGRSRYPKCTLMAAPTINYTIGAPLRSELTQINGQRSDGSP